MNIFDEATLVHTDISECTKEEKKRMMEYGFDSEFLESDNIVLSYQQVNDLHLENAIYEQSCIDNDILESILMENLGEAPHYLVFASNCTWDGKSGYKFCDNLLDTISRDYDVSISIDDPRPQNTIIKCRESSHDVPTGGTTYILGLANEEYDLLKEYNFEQIEEYVENRFNLEQNREKIAEKIEKFMFTPEYSYCTNEITPIDTLSDMFNVVYPDLYKEGWKKESILEDLNDRELLEGLIDNLSTLKEEYKDRAASIEEDGSEIAPDDIAMVKELEDILENDIPKVSSQLIEYDNLEDFDLADSLFE